MKFQIIFAVFVFKLAYCNGQEQIPHSFSTSELILQSILDPRSGLFRPSIFDITKDSCPISESESDGHDIVLQDKQFLAFCERFRLNSVFNDTILDQICSTSSSKTERITSTWKTCGEHLAPHIDNCFAKQPKPNTSRATYMWKFSEGFSDYVCTNRQKFIENLIERPSGSLVCNNNHIREIMHCLGKQEKNNSRKSMAETNNVDTELCRSYDIVQHCINHIYKSKCTNYFQNVTEMLAQIKTAIDCQNFKSPLIDDGPGKNRQTQNGETRVTKGISSIIIPILIASCML